MQTLDLALLERNLRALRRSSPHAATAIEKASPRPDIQWQETLEGVPAGTITDLDPLGLAPVSRSLASARRPLEEARRLAEPVKVADAAVLVVLGFGLGYHIAELARRLGRTGILVVYEPDVSLLRSAFDRLDMAAWIEATNLVVLTDPDDAAAMAEAVHGNEHAIALGLQILEHPASRPRLGEGARRFTARFTDVVRAARTTVVTTMVQTQATLRNLTQNIDHYALGPGIADLYGLHAGRPAVVVAAGPSLERNIDLLSRPGVRERFVIVAVQTVLKTLLARGIRPHFVTALDFHEISARFYEGLTPQDVEGITLIVEPKVNPAVTGAFPGAVRCAADSFLDDLLGAGLARPMGEITPGATVAHLAYYFARRLGCDPVALVGQDLGFTDGQYYAAGAAIHRVWAAELNEFNTLEMLEWQRIVRHRHLLRRAQDVQGRSIYTDEQMSTYLVQFQRDFKADAERGLTTIDATEGGVAKQHTTAMPLSQFLDLYGRGRPLSPSPAVAAEDAPRLARQREVIERIRSVRQDVWTVGKLSRDARVALSEMLEHHADQARVNRLIEKVERLRDRVTSLRPAFDLVQRMNQTGAFNRTRADRAINLGPATDPVERQRRQIERDMANVAWLADAADALGALLEGSLGALGGAPKRTRDPTSSEGDPAKTVEVGAGSVHIIIPIPETDAPRPMLDGDRSLAITLARLDRIEGITGGTLLSTNPGRDRPFIDSLRLSRSWRIEQTPEMSSLPRRSIAVARAFAPDCWRGAPGNLTCYDAVFDPALFASAMQRAGADASLIVGHDWCCVDPTFAQAVIRRYREDPRGHRLTFTMASPGLAPALIDRSVALDLARNRPTAGSFASIGGMLGYVPIAPMADLIARSVCVPVDPIVRDCLGSCILDTPDRARLLAAALRQSGLDPLHATALQIAEAIDHAAAAHPHLAAGDWPRHLRITLYDFLHAEPLAAWLSAQQVGRPDATLTLVAPLAAADWGSLLGAAHIAGFSAVHVHTDLVGDAASLDSLITAAPDVVSIDRIAEDPALFTRLRPDLGEQGFVQSRANMQRLMASRGDSDKSGIPLPWVVARLTRRDEVYEQVEPFVDSWLMQTGSAVLDPLPKPIPGARIAPLPLPLLALRRKTLTTFTIDALELISAGAPSMQERWRTATAQTQSDHAR